MNTSQLKKRIGQIPINESRETLETTLLNIPQNNVKILMTNFNV